VILFLGMASTPIVSGTCTESEKMDYYYGKPSNYARQYAASLCYTRPTVNTQGVATCRSKYGLTPFSEECNACLSSTAMAVMKAKTSCQQVGAQDNKCLDDQAVVNNQYTSGCLYESSFGNYFHGITASTSPIRSNDVVMPTGTMDDVKNACSVDDKLLLLKISWGGWFSVQNCVNAVSAKAAPTQADVSSCLTNYHVNGITNTCAKCIAFVVDSRDTCKAICLKDGASSSCTYCLVNWKDYIGGDPYLLCLGSDINTRAGDVIKATKSTTSIMYSATLSVGMVFIILSLLN